MEYADAVAELVTVSAWCIGHSEIEKALLLARGMLRCMPKVPNVIYKSKRYGGFKIVDRPGGGDVYILLCDAAADMLPPGRLVALKLQLGLDYFTHTEILTKLIPPEHALSAFETVGSIIHLNLSAGQLVYRDVIGKVLHYKTGCTVINKIGQIDTQFRYYKFEVLAGPSALETVHCENNVRIFLDLEKVYWCSRLQTERRRIVEIVRPGESLCDPFCGAGPQVLPVLQKGGVVYANDLNPDAVRCLERSLLLNKLRCDRLSNTDAAHFIASLAGRQIDHFVLNLPEHSIDYIHLLKGFPCFMLHCFFFCRAAEDPVELIRTRTGYAVEQAWLRRVRMVSPTKAVYKLEVHSSDFAQLYSAN